MAILCPVIFLFPVAGDQTNINAAPLPSPVSDSVATKSDAKNKADQTPKLGQAFDKNARQPPRWYLTGILPTGLTQASGLKKSKLSWQPGLGLSLGREIIPLLTLEGSLVYVQNRWKNNRGNLSADLIRNDFMAWIPVPGLPNPFHLSGGAGLSAWWLLSGGWEKNDQTYNMNPHLNGGGLFGTTIALRGEMDLPVGRLFLQTGFAISFNTFTEEITASQVTLDPGRLLSVDLILGYRWPMPLL